MNEYRVFFFGGIAKYIAWGDDIPNLCTSDYETETDKSNYSSNNSNIDDDYEALNKDDKNIKKKLSNLNPSLGREVLRFAKRVYKDYLKIFWKNDFRVGDCDYNGILLFCCMIAGGVGATSNVSSWILQSIY